MSDRERTLFPNESLSAFEVVAPDGKVIGRFPYIPPTVKSPQEEAGTTTSAFKRGALNTASNFADFAGLLSEAAGANDMATNFYKAAEDYSLRASKYVPTIGRIENVKSLGDAGIFAWEVLVENAPMLASMVIPGGLVGKGVGLLTKSAKAAKAAGATAAFLSDVGLQTGESVNIAQEHGASPVDLRVVGSGLGKAALDFAPLLGVAKKFGLAKGIPFAETMERAIFGELANRGFLRRAARGSAGIMAAEVPTEVTQEVMNIALSRAFSQYEGQFTAEEKSQMLNAAAGAAAFGLLGIPAAIAKPKAEAGEPPPEPPNTQPNETGEGPPSDGPGGGAVGPTRGDFTMGGPLEGEWLPPEIVIEDMPPGLPDPTRRLPPGEGPDVEFTGYPPALPPPPGGGLLGTKPVVDPTEVPVGEPVAQGRVFYVDSDGVGSMSVVSDPMEGEVLLPVDEEIMQRGEPILSAVDAMQRWENGDTIYAFHEMDGRPSLVTSLEQLQANTYDQLVAVPKGPIQRGLQLTKEQLEVAKSYPQYLNVEPTSPEGQAIAGLHPGLQRAMEIRDELLADEENYRTTDGQLKAAAQVKVDNIEKKIAVIQKALGLNAENYNTQPATEKAVVEDVKQEEAVPVPISPRQKERLAILEEKEMMDGLTDREYEEYSQLLEVAAGVRSAHAATRAQTKEELKEIDEVTKSVLEGDYKRTRAAKARTVDQQKDKAGIAPLRAQEVLAKLARTLRFGPKVRLLDPRHPEVIREQMAHKGKLRGYWAWAKPGEIVIIPENIADEATLIRTYLHETFAHYGLRTILTENQIHDLMQSILRNPPPNLDVTHIQSLLEEGNKIGAWIEVEEYIASIAEEAIYNPQTGLIQQTWWQRFIAFMKRQLRKITRVTWSDNDLMYLLRDVSKALTGRITPSNYTAPGVLIEMDGSLASVVGKETARKVNEGLGSTYKVWGARFAKWFFTPLQFSEQYKVDGTQEFLEFVQQWWARKRTLTDNPAQIAQEFLNLGPRNQQKLSQLVMEISIRSDELERRLTPEEEMQVFKELGMDGDTALVNLWRDMDKSFQTVIENLREGLMVHALRVDSKRTKAAAQTLYKKFRAFESLSSKEKVDFIKEIGPKAKFRLDEIQAEMDELLNRNYFPRSRFGNWSITIRAKKDMTYEGKAYKGPKKGVKGEVVYFGTYATQREQEAAFKELQATHPDASYQMQAGVIQDEDFHFLGTMSPQLYETLKIRLEGMNEIQMNTLKEIYLQQSPGRSFLRHLTKRKGIAGYSEDVLRVYAAYMMNVANHIARVEFHLDMNEQLGVIKEAAKQTVPDARVESIVSNYFQDQFDYLMNPKNDLAQLRSLGFLWYLGFNVKSAVVNLTQVPMIAHSFLAGQYGDAASATAISKAIAMVTKMRVGGELADPEIREMLNRAIKEGFVDESRATELAGLAENSTLERLTPLTNHGKLLQKTSYWGAFLFQKAERINREITFIAAYNLAKDKQLSKDAAFIEARRAVQTAMFEYAKWNRPKFMRGNKSVFFLFWQYMQGLSYMAFGGAGAGSAMRVWLMLLLAGGLQGLPFAENILDLVDFVGTKSKEKLGMENPRVDLREDLRRLAGELTDRPDMIMHGLSRYYGLGPLHMLNLLGIPVPNVDISGSVSAGRVIPGTDSLTDPERDPAAKLGRTMVDVFGPVAGIGYQFFRAATDSNVDNWKVWERALPVSMKNVSAAARRAHRGEESYRGGGAVAKFDWHDGEGRAELIASALGFGSTRLNQRYEVDFAVNTMKEYWRIRRALVMENVAMARMAGDPEVMKDARDALLRFNQTAPDPALRINSEQLMQSLKQRFHRASLREKGVPSELLFRRVEEAMRDLYPEASVEI